MKTLAGLNCVLDFYWSPAGDPSGHGEGRTYIGSTNVTSDVSGNASFSKTFVGVAVPVGAVITATATDAAGNTSEFSLNRAAVNGNTAPVLNPIANPVLAENTTLVTTVTATDADLPAQTLTFSISGGADAARFTINGSTGVLSFLAAPNFEVPTDDGANNVYNVTVQVSDGMLTDTQAIAVTVTPVNDNNPVITSDGGGPTAAVSIAENTTAVTTVTATDADLPAQTLTYSISGGADAARFAIDSATGALSFLAAPDYEAPTDDGANNVYDLTVQVSDGIADRYPGDRRDRHRRQRQ